MKLVYGEMFKKPLESTDGTVQRILASNPAVTQNYLRKMVESLDYDLIPSTVKYGNIKSKTHNLLLRGYNKFLKEHNIIGRRGSKIEAQTDYEDSLKRTCPECALYNYHTPIFHIPWIIKCPIHEELLTTRCPDCLTSWKIGLSAKRSKCERCGLYTSFLEKVNQRQVVKDSAYSPFLKLDYFLNNPAVVAKLVGGFSTENFSRDEQQYFHAEYPSIAVKLQPKLKPILDSFGVRTVSVTKFSYRITKAFTLEEYDGYPGEPLYFDEYFYRNTPGIKPNRGSMKLLPSYLIRIRKKAVDTICREVRSHFNLNYWPNICYSKTRGYFKSSCPYSIALSFWYYYLLCSPTKLHYYFTPIKNPMYGPNARVFFPDPVMPVRFVLIKNDAYELSKAAQEKIYLNDLLQLYKILYHYAKRFMEAANDFPSGSLEYKEVAKRCYINSSTGANLAAYSNNSTISIYIPNSDLDRNFRLEKYTHIEKVFVEKQQKKKERLRYYYSDQFKYQYDKYA